MSMKRESSIKLMVGSPRTSIFHERVNKAERRDSMNKHIPREGSIKLSIGHPYELTRERSVNKVGRRASATSIFHERAQSG